MRTYLSVLGMTIAAAFTAAFFWFIVAMFLIAFGGQS